MITSKARLIGAALCCALLVSLTAVGSASAATTLGDSLAGNPYPGTSGMVLLQVRNSDESLYAGSPVGGVLTSISVKASGSAGTVRVTLERQSSPFNTPTNFTGFTKLADVAIAVPTADPFGVVTTVPTQTTILPGDRFGLEVDSSNVSTNVLQVSSSTGACAYSSFSSPAAVGTARDFYTAGGSCSYVPSVQGTVEPDADADGYGDETQDLCPTDATRQTACPAIVGPGLLPAPPADLVITAVKSKSKRGASATRSFIVKNIGGTAAAPMTFSIKSTKALKKLNFVKGCTNAKGGKSCTVAKLDPNASVTIKITVAPKKATSTKITAKVSTVGETAIADNSVSTTVKFKLKK